MKVSDDRANNNGPNTAERTDAQILDSSLTIDDGHIPAPAPHVGGDPPAAHDLFNAFVLDGGGEAWVSEQHPVDVQEVR